LRTLILGLVLVTGCTAQTSLPPSGDAGGHQDAGELADAGDGGAQSAMDGGSDAGTDAGADAGQGTDGGTEVSCPGGAKCESFDTGSYSSDWSPSTYQATVAVSSDRAHSGSYSMHVQTNGNVSSGQTAGNLKTSVSIPSSGIYMRMFVWMPVPQTIASVFILARTSSPWYGMELNIKPDLALAVDDWTAPNKWVDENAVMIAANQWVCIEWEVVPGATSTTGTSRAWIDGQLAFTFNNMPTAAYGELQAGYGFSHPNGQAASEAWVDDIAVHTGPIGCN
jgi:hypothetical protein